MGADSANSARTETEHDGTPTAHSSAHIAGTPEWRGNERYDVVRRIGEGGMGVVYEAYDRDRGHAVALKTVQVFAADALYRFKQEFRTLADVHHTNLVRLYELVATAEGQVFFTMELVHGTDFTRYVRGSAITSRPPTAVLTPVSTSRERGTARPGPAAGAINHPALALRQPEVERLRPALRQLVQGVHAIHLAGKLHRDLKPSNVLVTRAGRVVILDFGVATELLDVDTAAPSGTGETVGTARYMAPEQAGGEEAPDPASDWYSVGVMLYEALVGGAPFVGSMTDVLALKNSIDPTPPSACADGIPADLDALCMALLRRAPEERPTGEAILRILGATRSSSPPPPVATDDGGDAFIGRESQLLALRDAFDCARAGRSITVRVAGAAGIGKSTIVNHFLDTIVRSSEAVVLRGRAYEREEIPYKAVDTLIDALSRHLLRLVEADEPLDLPDDIGALAHVFPVLQRIPDFADRARELAGDRRTFRPRAFSALRALLAWLAKRQPLVLFVDDAQWGDVDSATLLLDVLKQPEAPALLLLMTHRDDQDSEPSPFLTEMRGRWPEGAEARDVPVGPLEMEDARRLALTLLESDDDLSQRTARAVARESAGSPFLIEELVRSNRGAPGPEGATLAVLTLHQMVGQRLDRLTPDARRLAEIIAVAGRPVPLSVVGAAAGVEERLNELLAFVTSRRFARIGMRGGLDVVEVIHDRVRETIVTLLPSATLRGHHERIATVLETRPGADPESIATHFLGAGLTDRAKPFARAAADQALAAFAYERAARLYARALDLITDDAARREMQEGRAQALASAGRVEEAAPAFLEAAAGGDPIRALDLRRQAAEQFVMAANFDAANETLGQVLASVGMKMPSSRLGLVILLLVYRALLWLRGTRYVLRDEATIPKAVLVKLDTCSAVARMFSVTDPVLGAYFQARLLLLTLRHGEAFRLAYALCLEGSYRAVAGIKAGASSDRAFDLAATVARLGGSARIERSVMPAMRGFAALVQGRIREALEVSDRATLAIRDVGPGVYWALRSTQLNALWALSTLGELKELSARLKQYVDEAVACGDVWTATTLRTGGSFTVAWLCDHEPDTIRAWVDAGVSQWTRRVYHNQHLFACYTLIELDLYEGRGRAAYERIEAEFPRARRALKFNMEIVHMQARGMRARAALLAAAQTGGEERQRLVKVARGDARWLRRDGPPGAAHLAALIEAGIADIDGDRSRCVAALEDAIARADAGDFVLAAAAARFRLGSLLGERGRPLVEMGEAFMRAQRVSDPVRLAALYVPLADHRDER